MFAAASSSICSSKRGEPMTETDWLSCTDVVGMLRFLRGKVSERKLRLFVAAFGIFCCSRCFGRAYSSSTSICQPESWLASWRFSPRRPRTKET